MLTIATATAAPPTRHDAWRFLTQATFGPSRREVDELVASGSYQAWLDRQFQTQPRQSTVDIQAESLAYHRKIVPDAPRIPRWTAGAVWEQFLSGPDQLRQRMAFALSEIMVVSLKSADLLTKCTAVASYHDMLLRNAFGSFRTLIEDVCRHPAMGLYLSHLSNPGPEVNEGRIPDQNFARELMQLFTIGLVKLNPDGSVQADGGGETYTQADIEVMSYVFTGWGWNGIDWYRDPVDNDHNLQAQTLPMKDWDHLEPPFSANNVYKVWNMHATLADYRNKFVPDASNRELSNLKIPLLGKVFTPDGTCEGDLRAALNILLSHQNVAPFIARQLIQRLVTSNPSAAYVRRVADAFKASGLSLKVLVQSILLDDEAREGAATIAPTYGKLREPVLRVTAALRAFGFKVFENAGRPICAMGETGHTNSPMRLTNLGQGPYQAPSVFNFFRPSYVAPGSKMRSQGLVTPEFQACTETDAAAYVRLMQMAVTDGFGMEVGRPLMVRYGQVRPVVKPQGSVEFDFSEEFKLAQASDWEALIRLLDDKLLGGRMSAGLKKHIQGALSQPYRGSACNADEVALRRVQLCAFLILASAEFVVQK